MINIVHECKRKVPETGDYAKKRRLLFIKRLLNLILSPIFI